MIDKSTSRYRKYMRRKDHHVWDCDRMCDIHSGRKDRLMSRAYQKEYFNKYDINQYFFESEQSIF
jgi:hypothetical protein